MKRKRYYRPEISSLNIPGKASRVLNLILVVMILIGFRIWHLSIVQHEEKIEESRKPQKKVVIEAARRGTIRDRFNIPLAINKIQYQAAIVYSQIKQVPPVIWETNEEGKRVKRYKRKEYIAKLAALLAQELDLNPERLEDLIYSKAAFYHQYPFVIKEEISEKEYYRLKMLEKDWLGIHVQHIPKRHYPKNRVGADILGFMGAINRQEYESIIGEIKQIQEYIQKVEEGEDVDLPPKINSYAEAQQRLKELEAHAYTVNDSVGKAGIEGRFEEFLRGYNGKKSYYSDSRGNFLRELPGARKALSGQRILLTISAELQEYAEKLLTQNEQIRKAVISNRAKQELLADRQPWIKGGAIVALDPNNGEVLALASYPRSDPNDFIAAGNAETLTQKQSNILRWFESESYIANIWDHKRPLERELYENDLDLFYEEQLLLDWTTYLNKILPPQNPIRKELQKIKAIGTIVHLQNLLEKLLQIAETENAYAIFNLLYDTGPHQQHKIRLASEEKDTLERLLKSNQDEINKIKKELDLYLSNIPHNYDKVLFFDLCRLLIRADLFSPALIKSVGQQSPDDYRNASADLVAIVGFVRETSKDIFHELTFKEWRKEHEKGFLKDKREIEKIAKLYPKPYLDYLDNQEKEMFKGFWKDNHLTLLTLFLTGKLPSRPAEDLEAYIDHFHTLFSEIGKGAHQSFPWIPAYNQLQKKLQGIDAVTTALYLNTLRSFHDLNRPLLGSYRMLRKDKNKKQLEKHLAAAFYPTHGYGYGRSHAYRQATTQGSIFKLVTSYEALVQRYRKLGRSHVSIAELNPLDIVDATHRHGKTVFVGFTQEGTPIPQLYKGGRLLKSSSSKIGKLDILKALETSSNPYFSLLAGDALDSPEDLSKAAALFSYGSKTGIDLPAELSGKIPSDLLTNRTGLYAMANGQHTLVVTPLQTAVCLAAFANGGKVLKPNIIKMTISNQLKEDQQNNLITRPPIEVQRNLFMPMVVRDMLFEGMRRVVHKQLNDSITRLSRLYKDHPEAIADYLELKNQFIGKSSTSESMEMIDLDRENGINLYTHVWFGGISFNTDVHGLKNDQMVFYDNQGKPELIVVVYLKYGAWGREAAPVAAQIVKKWREIKEKRQIKL